MVRSESGVTLVEVIVSILILTSGVLGIASATASMISMLSRSDRATTASTYAQERLEQLRAVDCTAMAGGSETKDGVYQLTWTVATSGRTRRIAIVTTYPGGRSTRYDTVQTSFTCG